jgi:hypothetical protein
MTVTGPSGGRGDGFGVVQGRVGMVQPPGLDRESWARCGGQVLAEEGDRVELLVHAAIML